jgi:predicted enzyme related to lactoylglutathione lyase
MTIKRIRTVYYPASSVDALMDFYQDALQLELKFRDGDDWAEFRTGDASFALGSPAETPPNVTGAVAVFESDELDGLIERVGACGGKLLGQRDMGAHGTVATFRDPQGNLFQVVRKP